MNILESLTSAIKQLMGSKGRTILTMLGMLIGVGSVIMIFSLGTGFQDFIKKQFSDIGLGVFVVVAKSESEEALITQEDFEVIQKVEGIKSLAMADMNNATLVDSDSDEFDITLTGVKKQFVTEIQPLTIVAGRNMMDKDEASKSNSIIIADLVGKTLFGNKDYEEIIGETIQIIINNQPTNFEIIGLYKHEAPSGLTKKEREKYYSRCNYYTTFNQFKQLMGQSQESQIIQGLVEDGYEADVIATKIGQILNKRHHLQDAYQIQTISQIVEMVDSVMSVLKLYVSALASISLVVGGVGIMNIMLVTVKERTREIGIRKALGASNKAILLQFIIEALLITFIAGFMGLVLGYVGAISLGALFNIQATFTLSMLLFSTLTSIAIGLIFGVYPAYQAAQLDPIEALRLE